LIRDSIFKGAKRISKRGISADLDVLYLLKVCLSVIESGKYLEGKGLFLSYLKMKFSVVIVSLIS